MIYAIHLNFNWTRFRKFNGSHTINELCHFRIKLILTFSWIILNNLNLITKKIKWLERNPFNNCLQYIQSENVSALLRNENYL